MVRMTNNITSRSVARISSLLKCFTQGEPELGISEISRRVNLPKSTVHRTLSALVKEGLIVQNEETGKYTIGPELVIIGSIYASITDILTAAKPVMKTLNELTGETIVLSVVDKGHVRIITHEEPTHALRYFVPLGHMKPAYASAMGRAMLSDLTDEEIDNLFPEESLKPVTSKTVSAKKGLKELLEQVRKTGISYNPEGMHEGIHGIAAAIRDSNGHAVAAVALPVPIFRINPAKLKCFGELTSLGATVMSYRLGYQDPDVSIRSIEDLRSWWKKNQTKSSTLSK